jgi:hypothetical protein
VNGISFAKTQDGDNFSNINQLRIDKHLTMVLPQRNLQGLYLAMKNRTQVAETAT